MNYQNMEVGLPSKLRQDYFSEAYTLDPSQSLKAFDRLTENVLPMHIASLPAILHNSLIHVLQERQDLSASRKRAD
jgi:hypothetical protein